MGRSVRTSEQLCSTPSTTCGRGGRCGCGHCPSIDLGDASGEYPSAGPRVVLDGWRGAEGVLLFIDNGLPTYLEQYSHTDDVFDEFVPVSEIEYH